MVVMRAVHGARIYSSVVRPLLNDSGIVESHDLFITTVGEQGLLESASRPLVDFGVLNDNLIK
jgi:hypothetical protein